MNPQAKSEYQAIMNLKRVLREKLPTLDTSIGWPPVKARIQELQKTTRAEYVVGSVGIENRLVRLLERFFGVANVAGAIFEAREISKEC